MNNKYISIKQDLHNLGFNITKNIVLADICDLFENSDITTRITYRYGNKNFCLEKLDLKTDKWITIFKGIVNNKNDLMKILKKHDNN